MACAAGVTAQARRGDDQAGKGAATPKTPAAERTAGVPCRPRGGAVSGTVAPGRPPTAYAPGGAGRAELNIERRRMLLTDDRRDGCATILAVTTDHGDLGTWANTHSGPRNGTPTPPKLIDMPRIDTIGWLKFRVCLGEVIQGRPTVREEGRCGPWTTADLKAAGR